MNCQMMRVISSPSSSTTGFATLIFAIAVSFSLCRKKNLKIADVGLLCPDCFGCLVQRRQFVLAELRLDDSFYATCADFGLDAEINTADAVLAVDPRTHGH